MQSLEIYWLKVILFAVIWCACSNGSSQEELTRAREYLERLSHKVCARRSIRHEITFNYVINATEENLMLLYQEEGKPDLYAADLLAFDWKSFNDSCILRQAKKYGFLDRKQNVKLIEELANITSIMTNAKLQEYPVRVYKNDSIKGQQAQEIADTAYFRSHDADELTFYWKQALETGPRLVRLLYEDYINMSNQIANINDFPNRALEWMDYFESPPVEKFESTLLDIWDQLKPLYLQYHAYIRSRLRTVFGEKAVPRRGPIQTQLIRSTLTEFQPYQNTTSIFFGIAYGLVKKKDDVFKIVKHAEDFYKSMGFPELPASFWEHSMFTKPENRPAICSAKAWDFLNSKEYRISMCGTIDYPTIMTSLHEVGQIYNFMYYDKQPCCFREIPAILDSVEMMTLSFTSYKHLKELGFFDKVLNIPAQVQVNDLYFRARLKLNDLPMALGLELWRWDAFKNKITSKELNTAYWKYRLKFEGVVPPEIRGEEYLDAAEEMFMVSDIPVITKHFLSTLYEFQMHEALCIAAGEYDPKNPSVNPLHNCNLYQKKEAGQLLKNMFSLGTSKPWTESLAAVSGKNYIDPGSMLRYFKPFYDWLVESNERSGEYIGWE